MIVRTFVEGSLLLQPPGGIQDDDDDDEEEEDGEDDEDDRPHPTRTGISGASNVKHHARRHIGSC